MKSLKSMIRRLLGSNFIDVSFVPQGDLQALDSEGATRTKWSATGVDPRFHCETKTDTESAQELLGGWYGLELDISFEPNALIQPALYPNYGSGMSEGSRLELPFVQDRSLADLSVVRFVENVQALRFDPSTSTGEFSLGTGRLRRLSRVQAVSRMVRAILRRDGSSGAFWRLARQLRGRLSEGGLRSMAGWLYERYSRVVAFGENGPNTYHQWIGLYENRMSDTEEAQPAAGPTFSIVVPVYNTSEKWLRKCIESVIAQSYPKWELCISNDASTQAHVRSVLDEYQRRDSRVRVHHRERNGHISLSSNDGLAMASGQFVALLDHDDELAPNALREVHLAIAGNPHWKILYSDEDKIDEQGVRYDPYFKPDWNYDLFLSQNCISHLGVYETDLVRQVGGFRQGLEGSQDWDLALRCIEHVRPDQIGHIPHVLYHWRAIAGSTALGVEQKDYAGAAALRAVSEHLTRIGCKAHAELAGPGRVRVRRELPERVPRVSLIIPTRDRVELLRTCVGSILSKTSYADYEILIVDNQSVEAATLAYFNEVGADTRVRVLRYDKPFNYSSINNFAAMHATGQILGLVNNDIEVEGGEWLSEMVGQAVRPDVGAVGAMLLYPDDTIQHAGVILGMHGIAGHVYAGMPRNFPGQMGRALLTQEMSAVTAACLLVRKEVFEEVGGLDEGLSVAFNDIDFCLRVRAKGYRNLWTPYAVLYHHESASRGYEDTPEKKLRFEGEIDFMRLRWGEQLLNDPAYNRNLSLGADEFQLAFPPRTSPLS